MDWIRNHIYEINFFIAGWCAFAFLDQLVRGNYLMALLNAVLVYINIKLANK